MLISKTDSGILEITRELGNQSSEHIVYCDIIKLQAAFRSKFNKIVTLSQCLTPCYDVLHLAINCLPKFSEQLFPNKLAFNCLLKVNN